MADTTRRILSQLGHEPQNALQERSNSALENKGFMRPASDLPEKKLTFEALSQLCLNPLQEKRFSPD